MRQDRFLTGILIFIGALVLLALGLFFVRQGSEQTYGPEDSPPGVVRNYIIALQKNDYVRAYSYLAEGSASNGTVKPDLGQYRQSMANISQDIASTGIQIGDVQPVSAQEVNVTLDIVRNPGGLFGSANHQLMTAVVVREGQAWKIRSMPYPFWAYDLPAAPVVKPPQ